MLSLSWLGSRRLVGRPKKPAIAATRKQERLGPVVRIGLHCAQENYVVAARIPAGGAALEICHAVGKDRCVAEARRPIDPSELVFRGFGESGRERLLRYPKYVDREMAGILEDAQALRKLPQAPEHQWRVQRHRGERIAGQPIGLSVGPDSRDDGDARGIGAQRVT